VNPNLPAGFWLCLAGAVVGGGVGLWLLARLFRRASPWVRLRALASEERGTAIVEFPFALITVILLTLLTWQLTFMCVAYQVVDYAAYVSTRVAIVTIPKDWAPGEGKLAAGEASGPSASVFDGVAGIQEAFKGYYFQNKRRDLRFAAVFACFPISGNKKESGTAVGGSVKITTPFGDMDFGALTTVPWPDVITELLNNQDFVTRFFYANAYTAVDVEPANKLEYGTTDDVTVVVRHQYSLRVPFAGLLFRDFGAADGGINEAGPYTTITGRATMLVEAGTEATPPTDPPDAGDEETN